MWAHHVHKPSPECAALLNTRVRVKGGVYDNCVGTVKNVCPDKLGKPYQVQVVLDGDAGLTIFGPDEVESEAALN